MVWSDGRERKTTRNSAAPAATMITVKKNKTSRRKMLVVRSSRDGFLLQNLVLRLGEEALAGPFRQEFAGAQSLFTGCAVDSHAGLPKRRPIWTSADEHGDSTNHEIAQQDGDVSNCADEHRADAHVAVDGSISNEGKLRGATGPRRETRHRR